MSDVIERDMEEAESRSESPLLVVEKAIKDKARALGPAPIENHAQDQTSAAEQDTFRVMVNEGKAAEKAKKSHENTDHSAKVNRKIQKATEKIVKKAAKKRERAAKKRQRAAKKRERAANDREAVNDAVNPVETEATQTIDRDAVTDEAGPRNTDNSMGIIDLLHDSDEDTNEAGEAATNTNRTVEQLKQAVEDRANTADSEAEDSDEVDGPENVTELREKAVPRQRTFQRSTKAVRNRHQSIEILDDVNEQSDNLDTTAVKTSMMKWRTRKEALSALDAAFNNCTTQANMDLKEEVKSFIDDFYKKTKEQAAKYATKPPKYDASGRAKPAYLAYTDLGPVRSVKTACENAFKAKAQGQAFQKSLPRHGQVLALRFTQKDGILNSKIAGRLQELGVFGLNSIPDESIVTQVRDRISAKSDTKNAAPQSTNAQTDLEEWKTTVNKNFKALMNFSKSLQDKITKLETDNKELKNDMRALKNDNLSLKHQVEASTSESANLMTTTAKLGSDVSEMMKILDTLTTSKSALGTQKTGAAAVRTTTHKAGTTGKTQVQTQSKTKRKANEEVDDANVGKRPKQATSGNSSGIVNLKSLLIKRE